MLYKLCILLMFLLLTSCAITTEPENSNLDFKTVEKLALSQIKSKKDTLNYQNFMRDWLAFHNNNKIDELNSCYKKGSGKHVIILVQDESGKVEHVATKSDNKLSRCFRKLYIGRTFPKPPYSPFYHHMTMLGQKSTPKHIN